VIAHSQRASHRDRASLLAATVLALALTACPSAKPPYVPRDPVLRALPLYFYPASDSAKAVVIFFGNDIGFWDAHDRLARQLASNGYTVIGVDIKKYIDRLPEPYASREAAFDSSIDGVIARAVREMRATSLPLVLGGHSFGADLALWTAAHAPPPHTVGVLALAPTARSHFYVTATDRANIGEPDEPGSFAISDEIRAIPSNMRIALLRGSGDRRKSIDSALEVAGKPRLRYSVIPFASHSLKSLTIAGPMAQRAVGWIVSGA
jgi:type IV secretory pathway VirJ component